MRVLHVTGAVAPVLGGTTRAALETCEALAARGAEVTLFTTDLDEQGRWSPLERPALLDVPTDRSLFVAGVERRHFRARWPSRSGFSPGLGRALRDRAGGFDVLHVHSLYLFTTVAACRAALLRRVPYVIQPHGTLDPYHRGHHALRKAIFDRLLQRRLLDRAAAVHYTSEDERTLAQPFGIQAPAVVVPLGVDPAEFADLPAPCSFTSAHPELDGRRLVVFLGRLTAKKGLDTLIAAFAGVLSEVPDAHLVLAGPEDGDYGRAVRRMLAAAGVAGRATLTGMVQGRRKLALLAGADVWVLPSRSENFGFAAVEAMACGAPVVLSDRVSIHREVAAAGAGLVVPGDAGAVGAAIARVLTDAGLRARLAAAGPELVRRRFTRDRTAEGLLALYANVSEAAA